MIDKIVGYVFLASTVPTTIFLTLFPLRFIILAKKFLLKWTKAFSHNMIDCAAYLVFNLL